MKNDNSLAIAPSMMVVGGAIAVAIDITAPACKAATAQLASAKEFDFGCLELREASPHSIHQKPSIFDSSGYQRQNMIA